MFNGDIKKKMFKTDIIVDLQQWLHDLPSNFIKPAQVDKIDIRDYEKKQKSSNKNKINNKINKSCNKISHIKKINSNKLKMWIY